MKAPFVLSAAIQRPKLCFCQWAIMLSTAVAASSRVEGLPLPTYLTTLGSAKRPARSSRSLRQTIRSRNRSVSIDSIIDVHDPHKFSLAHAAGQHRVSEREFVRVVN